MIGNRFLHQFTSDELAAIIARAKIDPVVRGFVQALSLSMTRDLDLTDPIFASGLNYLVSAGLITPDRPATILAGQAVRV